VLAFLVIATGVMVFYILGFRGKEFNMGRTRALNENNLILEKQIAVLDSTLSKLHHRIDHLESLNVEIISESGISEMDLERFGEIDNDYIMRGRTIDPEMVFALINRLDKESEAFDYNFSTLFDKCGQSGDFLRCVPSIRPSRGTITREFGRIQSTVPGAAQKAYSGIDITWEEGTPVVATADGVIEESDTNQELGRYIIIDHRNGYKTRYAHLQTIPQMKDKIRVKAGDTIKRGDTIGAIGRTGISITATASHIMYSVYHHGIPVNPVDYFFASDMIAVADRETSSVQTQAPPRE
jgi:murein DD-endopeptidase MepM/ murein hydrolase activator NlpD